ncbi:MAG: hypothetical protein ETSY1_41040 [Candidatus Entotheonella factor]|uniref:Sugar-binding domain-containing protein n=1 Tax=Entotheonella factor TaxID=1429438 RepID=W4L4I9_ENTF1|nr:MAG: hypothetical protein ETSY1_41040 [Candidatus Entotheonella factor]
MKKRHRRDAIVEFASLGDSPQLRARICWYYFQEGQTQEAIAKRVGLTRLRVNRMLNEARASGFVQVSINSPVGACIELEAQLAESYGLAEVIVVPAPLPGHDERPVVGLAAGEYISTTLPADGVLGMTWGGTIHAAAQAIHYRKNTENVVVSLCGGLAKSTQINPYDNATMFARILDAECYYMTAPLIADSESMRDMLLTSTSVRTVLEWVPKIDVALLSAIDLTSDSKLLEYGILSAEQVLSLIDAGAVGDIAGHYLDVQGRRVSHALNALRVAPSLEAVRRIPKIVLAAGGLQKVAIIRAAIRAGLCHVLITEERAAAALVEMGPISTGAISTERT